MYFVIFYIIVWQLMHSINNNNSSRTLFIIIQKIIESLLPNWDLYQHFVKLPDILSQPGQNTQHKAVHWICQTQCVTEAWCSRPQGILSWIWRSCDRASLMYSFEYSQQDATLYNILYYCQCSTCWRMLPACRQHSPHSAHVLPPDSPASQQLQQERQL